MIKNQNFKFEPDYAIPPGETLQETMEYLGMTQVELAERTGLTVQSVNRIFKGEQPITFETAQRLEYVTGYAANFWNTLESQYREQLVKVAEARKMEESMNWLKSIPVRELKTRGVLPDTKEKLLLFRETLKFYGVSSVDSFSNIWKEPKAAARRSTAFKSAPGPTSAWLRLGQLQARKTTCQPYEKSTFLENLKLIRTLTTLPPDEFQPRMIDLCAASGVALSLVPEFKKAPWSGAAEWLTPTKAMILLCLRGKSEDKFWFTFFHEASHIIHDGKTKSFLDCESDNYANDPMEKRADRFAAEILIPKEHDTRIKSCRSKLDILKIAKELLISPGIVVGRYQHLTKKWNYFNDLKKRFRWKE